MPFKKPHHTSDTSFREEEGNGYLLKPRALNIVWGNDPRYWKLPENGPAELIQVSWLEVSGLVPITKAGTYSIKFNVKVKDDGFGWNGTEVLVMAKIGKNGKYKYKVASLTPGNTMIIPKNDSPLLIEVTSPESELYFGLYEVWSGKWKGGLEIIDAKIEKV